MIKISKPEAPDVLATRGAARRAKHCRDYDRSPAEYDDGRKTFPFDARIYGHEAVRQALIAAQHGKCCFCEDKIGAGGDVEHFRPKAGVCQGEGLPLERPGYYWLAYDWNNLLWSCPLCNQRFKGNHFPLINPAKRARSHRSDLTREESLLLNPAEVDPARLIGFRREVPYAVRGNRRGRETIHLLGLNRPDLTEARRDHLNRLVYLREVLDQEAKLSGTAEGRHVLEGARKYLQDATLDTAKFAAMARAAAAVDFRVTLP